MARYRSAADLSFFVPFSRDSVASFDIHAGIMIAAARAWHHNSTDEIEFP
jgi:hypothetical protein